MELLHYRNDDWVVICQVCYFFADRISKMAATGQLSLPLEAGRGLPNGSNLFSGFREDENMKSLQTRTTTDAK
jgi:hypothetical protein